MKRILQDVLLSISNFNFFFKIKTDKTKDNNWDHGRTDKNYRGK